MAYYASMQYYFHTGVLETRFLKNICCNNNHNLISMSISVPAFSKVF